MSLVDGWKLREDLRLLIRIENKLAIVNYAEAFSCFLSKTENAKSGVQEAPWRDSSFGRRPSVPALNSAARMCLELLPHLFQREICCFLRLLYLEVEKSFQPFLNCLFFYGFLPKSLPVLISEAVCCRFLLVLRRRFLVWIPSFFIVIGLFT